MIDHAVLIFDVGTSEVKYADPLAGRILSKNKLKFLETWDEITVSVKKKKR